MMLKFKLKSSLMTLKSSLMTMMFLSLLCLPSVRSAYALPVLDKNAPTGGELITMYPDHEDPNLYYLVPKSLQISHEANGVPLFNYTEYKYWFKTSAVIQTAMTPSLDDAKIERARQYILAFNPKAQFVPLAFHGSRVIFSDVLSAFVSNSDCNHNGGVVGSDVACTFALTPRGRMTMLDALKKRATLYLHFEYTVLGVLSDGKGGYTLGDNKVTIAGAIGGAELANYPELFLDPWGNVIRGFYTENVNL